ncbi:MAG: hypothetical protein ABIR06_20800 [Cyclobacteriaceae bacterium]
MKKYSLLIAVLALFVAGHVLAQDSTDRQEVEKNKQETVKTEDKPATVIKVVPSARNKNAKPAKVNSAKGRNVRPGGTRPARNVRPSSRPVRPGSGRN